MASATKFGSDNRGTIACFHCGKLTWEQYSRTKGVNGETCGDCAAEFEQENEHNDYGRHEWTDGKHCPICHPERQAARMAKVREHNAKLQINLENRTREARERANRKAEEKAAKEASIKRCAGSHSIFKNGVEIGREACDSRASKTSDYCSICRPYHPHKAVKFTGRVFGDADPATLCGLCGGSKSDQIHEVTK